MNGLTFSSFVKCVKGALQPPNTNEAVVGLLLDWVVNKETVTDKKGDAVSIDSKLVSNLIRQKVDVPKPIKDFLSTPSAVQETIVHMADIVVPVLNPVMSNDLIGRLSDLIDADPTIPKEKAEELDAFKSESASSFLANVFLYAVARPNIDEEQGETIEEIILTRETNGICPKCGKPLFKNIKGKTISCHQIVDISDEGVPRSGAKRIMLCSDCADYYHAGPSKQEEVELLQLKDAIVKSQKAIEGVSKLDLLEDIAGIVNALCDIEGDLEELSLDALRVDKKFLPENAMAENEIRTYALSYYRYIESLFSDASREKADVHEAVASQVKSAWLELDRGGLSQPEIIERLTEWIRMHAGVPRSRANACKAVVAYFIQDCEVFREVSK